MKKLCEIALIKHGKTRGYDKIAKIDKKVCFFSDERDCKPGGGTIGVLTAN